jgi:spore coat protein U-like protein
MSRNRLLVVVALLCAGALVPATVQAQTATADLTVSATVIRVCTITAGTLAFGNYDPIFANDTTNLDQSGTFTVTCARGGAPAVWVGMGNGLNFLGSRRMAGGGEFLTYQLFSDAGRTTAWGNTSGTGFAPTPNGRNPVTVTVYGRVLAGQDVLVGAYTDTVVMTVNF